MSLIDSKAACRIWFALVVCAYGQNAAPNSGDRLEAETAARLREFAKNNNMGGPRRPMSPEMSAVADHPSLLENLGAEDLAKMTLDDPLLKWAYACVFLRSMGPLEQLEPPLDLALADMRRRGKAVSPMLLKLISENQENIIESLILGKVGYLDTVRIEPFLEYARKMLRERTQTMTAEAAGPAAYLLARHGTKEDEALFEWVIKERPFVADDLTKCLKILRERLNTKPESRPDRRNISSSNVGSDARSTKGTEDHPQDGGATTSQTKSWLIGGMILVLLLGVYRLLLKGRRRP